MAQIPAADVIRIWAADPGQATDPGRAAALGQSAPPTVARRRDR